MTEISRYLKGITCCPKLGIALLGALSISLLISLDLAIGYYKQEYKDYYFYEVQSGYSVLIILCFFMFLGQAMGVSRVLVNHSQRKFLVIWQRIRYFTHEWFQEKSPSILSFKLVRDQNSIESSFILALQEFLFNISVSLGGLLMINVVFIGMFIPVTMVIVVALIFLLRKFFRVMNQLTVFVSESINDLFRVYNESINQMVFYRMNQRKNLLITQFQRANDKYQQSLSHLNNYLLRWLGLRIAAINTFLIFCCFLWL